MNSVQVVRLKRLNLKSVEFKELKEDSKVPYYFTRNDEKMLFFAAIYDHQQFAIITQPPDTQVGTIHYRQPVIINDEV